ncbi:MULTISPECIES: LacI family DNA-binding transcriptional regulator [Anoxybacillaceae]|uniref:Substrate-binding domain-containing protein n=1 Tax=Anoxybacteroides rupiense TaxID=311460 RepID=A0ABD5ISS9_9BACL|nr:MULTISPECIES: substrate-binding domain-containing protein [Anoxybacillus]MBB3908060.1 LacI family kdg operon repressor [Anoxybacillus rupiensis]MED5051367.1 substrate-binding domain-containing protein [Anoxybacillus rupiensis]QHC04179.1 substrate-binding domain-containing protein [Anoxybacillus sp. PDR2]
MKRITMADVAKAAGVSKSTVSQFLNKRYEHMGEETKEKIREAIERLGYHPNYIARSLKQKRTAMIGIIVANIMHSFSTEISRAIEDFCHEHDMHAIVCNADDDPVKERKYIEMLRARQVDGLILFPTGGNLELYKQMEQERYPVVFVDRKISEVNIRTIVVNNKEATYQAVAHLIEKGHRDIAIITPPLTIYPRIERMNGYKQALNDYRIPIKQEYMISTEIQRMISELSRLFALPDKPTALVAGNDLSFFEVMKFLKENGLRVPNNVAVVVFDNIPFASFSEPTMTTIAQPAYAMGKKAAELLLQQIHHHEELPDSNLYTFPCTLMIRESSSRALI